MNKKAQTQLLIVVTLIAGAITIMGALGWIDTSSIASIVGYDTVYKQNWGHVCCEEGAYEPPYIRYADDVPVYSCSAYTDECRIKVYPAQDLGIQGRTIYYQICNLDGTSCTSKNRISFSGFSETTDTQIIYLDYGKSIEFSPYIFPNQNDWSYIKYEADYRRFYLQGEENGKIYTSTSCLINSDLKKRIGYDGLNELSKTGVNRCENYMIDFIQVETRTYSYFGKEVVCQSRQIYNIDEITFKDGITRKIQGNRIKSVECCPHESNCGDNFEFVGERERECTYDSECANGGEPVVITGTSYVTWNCINEECVQSTPNTVECTNNAVCVDKYNQPNMVCKNFKCSQDAEWLGHCGDGNCEDIIGETPTSCPEDCGEWENPPDYTLWIIIFLALAFIVIFHRQILAIFKSMLSKLGIRF